MQKNVEPVKIPSCVNAVKYFSNESVLVYSTIEDDTSRILRKFTFCDSISEVLSVKSENTYYIADTDNYCVYAVSIIDECLCITGFNEFEKKFVLETCQEDIIEAYYRYGIFFIETVEERYDCEQNKRLYMIDLFSNEILQIRNKECLESYHVPYILKSNENIKILVEDAKIFPYELRELESCAGYDFVSNKVLAISMDEFVKSVKGQESMPWEVIISRDEWNFDYVQVLKVQENTIIVACRDEIKNCTRVRWLDIETGHVNKDVVFCCEITDVLKKNGIVIAYVSWTEKKLAVYDSSGKLISEIFTDEFYKNNNNLELNSIITIVDEKLIFDARDYKTDDEKQIRVLYDVLKKEYTVYYAPFIMYNGDCY